MALGEELVVAEGLVKRYGATEALAGLDLRIAAGSVLGLLGHNGAGKTTAVGVLATLIRPDAGSARVGGRDVLAEPAAVREQISLAGQQASLDELLTGRENLVLLGRLQQLSRRSAAARARELLDRFALGDAADRIVRGYSGGMRRRLDLAACLMVPRPVIFLDEPTTGLDPASRLTMWSMIRGLVDDGSALLLTTQYLDEADRLANRITMLAGGRVVATGTPVQLKDKVGGRRVELELADRSDLGLARAALERSGYAVELEDRETRLSLPAESGSADLEAALEAVRGVGVEIEEAGLRRPSLDDVFFALAGEEQAEAPREAVAGGVR